MATPAHPHPPKPSNNHLFCFQLCNLIRGLWRRLLTAAVHGVSRQGSAEGWKICLQDCSVTQLLAVTWKLSLCPAARGPLCDLAFLTGWYLGSRSEHPKEHSSADAVVPFMISLQVT